MFSCVLHVILIISIPIYITKLKNLFFLNNQHIFLDVLFKQILSNAKIENFSHQLFCCELTTYKWKYMISESQFHILGNFKCYEVLGPCSQERHLVKIPDDGHLVVQEYCFSWHMS